MKRGASATVRWAATLFWGLLATGAALAAPKFQISFPNEPYAVPGSGGQPGWVKFAILNSDPTKVYFQNSNVYPFHYDFAVAELPGFQGMTPSQFDAATLHEQGQLAVLGAVLIPPPVAGVNVTPEYGIQFVRLDPYPPTLVRDLFYLVKSKVSAAPNVQAFYFPSFEQQATADANAAYFAAEGITISSTSRWAEGNACYSFGWALGTLKYVPAAQIDAAYLSGALGIGDILLTDGVPAEIPSVAGVISLTPSTPNSHVAILAETFRLPFVHLAVAADAQRAQSLVGHKIALRAEDRSGSCRTRLIDVEGVLDAATIDAILELKDPAPLNITPMAAYGAYSAPTPGLQPSDIRFFGGKAANFGALRRAIPGSSPVATAFSFDLWNGFLDQALGNGRTLRQEIAFRLAPFAYPPNMSQLSAALTGVQDLIRSTSQTSFSSQLQTAVIATLQNPSYGFDPDRNIRFRSSSNAEDGEQLTAAGLYDSFSGCLADDLDADTSGPSICDPSENNERGVFRAIRRVFASFYNFNAYLERLRFGVNETQVGMALLVHHSFPDDIELANGVATLEHSGGRSRGAYLVTQNGASSVTNPEPGAIPEEVDVYISVSGWTFPTVIRQSNLVPLGATVLEYPDDYQDLTALLVAAAEEYEATTGLTGFKLEFEYKKLAPAGALSVDQLRRIPEASTTPSITPFLIDEPTSYCLFQGEQGNVFANHRLKSRWAMHTRSMWLTPANLQSSIFTDASLDYAEVCQTYHQEGALPTWPNATHAYDSGTTVDGWNFARLQNPRNYSLTTNEIPTLVAPSQNPLFVLSDFGWGCLSVDVAYERSVPSIDWTGPITTTTDAALICRCPIPRSGDVYQQRYVMAGSVVVATAFYWPPPVDSAAGYTAPLSRFVGTTIYGLTSSPISLQSEYSQTYRPEHHNFDENFIFEPALEPGISSVQLAELQAAGIRAIHVTTGFSGESITYYSDAQWGDSCLGCTGFDGDHDGRCTGSPTFDCNDNAASVWAAPTEVPALGFSNDQTLTWSPPASPGAQAVTFDTLRASTAADFVSGATCIETNDGTDLSAVDVSDPTTGTVRFYLVRAENACPNGSGTLGSRSDGSERVGAGCP